MCYLVMIVEKYLHSLKLPTNNTHCIPMCRWNNEVFTMVTMATWIVVRMDLPSQPVVNVRTVEVLLVLLISISITVFTTNARES